MRQWSIDQWDSGELTDETVEYRPMRQWSIDQLDSGELTMRQWSIDQWDSGV